MTETQARRIVETRLNAHDLLNHPERARLQRALEVLAAAETKRLLRAKRGK